MPEHRLAKCRDAYAPPVHRCVFDTYDAPGDRVVCACGAFHDMHATADHPIHAARRALGFKDPAWLRGGCAK